ncbi:MAG: hypothetical protein GY851_18650 [bacterium]|nr:hypothetical protein [bacterium]
MSDEKRPVSSGSITFEQRTLVRLIARSMVLGFVAAVAAAAFSWFGLENEYRATAMLLVAPTPLTQESVKSPASNVSYLMVKPLSVKDYSQLLMNGEIVSKLRDCVRAELEKTGRTGDEILLEDVRNAMGVRTQILKQTMSDVVYQPVIELSFTSVSPAVASAAVNEWARLGVACAEELASKGKEGLFEFLGKQRTEMATGLGEAERTLELLRSEMDIPVWTKRLQAVNDQYVMFQMELATANADIANASGRLAELGEQLTGIKETITLRKAPPDEAYWVMAEGGEKPDASDVLVSEEVNEIHRQLRADQVVTGAELKGLEQRKTAIEQELALLEPQVADLQRKIASQERLQNEASREVDALTQQYLQLSQNFMAAQVGEAQDVPDLKIAAEAVPPERKVGPFRSVIVLAAALLGFMIAPAHFFGLRAMRLFARHMAAGPLGDRPL